jgi:tetratricopeptide (TPR) repeat protein
MRYMVDEKTIFNDEGTWKLAKDFKDFEIPSKIYNVIERRLNRLEKEDRKVLDYASVIGEMFTSSILSSALDMNRTQLLEQLRGLEQIHRLINSPNGNFKFDHAKIKEVLYNEIPEELRMDYHSIIANSIEELNKDNLDGVIEELAFHYYKCKDKKKAPLYLIKAAEKAKKDYSNEEAIRFYSESLEFEENKSKRREIFEVMGDILKLIGNYNKSIESYYSGLELTEENRKIAELKVKIGWSKEKIGEYDETVRICTEALDLVRGEECREEAFALSLIGYGYMQQGKCDKGLEYYEKSLEIEQKINDPKGLAMTYTGFSLFNWYQGYYDKVINLEGRSLIIKEKIGYLRGISTSNTNIGFCYGRLGEYEVSQKYFKNSIAICRKIGYQTGFAYIWWGLAEVYYGKGELESALDYTNQAFELSKKIGNREIIAEAYLLFGMIYGKQRKWDESIKNFEESHKIFKEINMKHELGNSYYEAGLMWKDKGENKKAKEQLNKALDIFEKLKLEKHLEKVKVTLDIL